MKKTILLLAGLFLIVSCEKETEKEIESPNTTLTIDPQIPYASPFLNTSCCSAVDFSFVNETNLHLNFTPFLGVSRFDGVPDNVHFGWPFTNPSDYPHIFAMGMEYLNLVECYPVPVVPFTSQNYSNMGQVLTQPNIITSPAVFRIVGNTPGIIAMEEGFFSEYGKFYSFIAHIIDPSSGNTVLNEKLKFPFLPVSVTDPATISPDWAPIPPMSAQTEDLWYNLQTREICIGNDYVNSPMGGMGFNGAPSIVEFHYMGTDYVLEARITDTGHIILLSFK